MNPISRVTMHSDVRSAANQLEEIRATQKKGSSSGVTPRSCIKECPGGKTRGSAARASKMAALGEVPPVMSVALVNHQGHPGSSAVGLEDLVTNFGDLLAKAGYSPCSVSHARTTAMTVILAAQAVLGRAPRKRKDLLGRRVIVHAIAEIRSTRSSGRRLPMLIRFVNYLHTDRVIDRTAISECDEIRLLCRGPVVSKLPRPISMDPSRDHPLAIAFIRELDAQNKGWQKRAKYSLRGLLRWLTDTCHPFRGMDPVLLDVTHVTSEHLMGYYEHLGDSVRTRTIARGTFRLRIQAVHRWFAYLYVHHFIFSDPSVVVPVVKGREIAPHRIITADEARAFTEAVLKYSLRPIQDLAIFACLSGLGLRPSEAVKLRVSDVDRHAAVLRVHGKGNKERLVPLPGPVLLALERHLATRPGAGEEEPLWIGPMGPLSYDTLREMFHRYCMHAGISRYVGGPHVFRHYFITENLLRGVDLEDLAALVGDDNIRALQPYFHTTDAGIRAAILRAYGELGGKE